MDFQYFDLLHDHGLGTSELYYNFGRDPPTHPDLLHLFGLPVYVGPQIGMNPKPILGLPDLEY